MKTISVSGITYYGACDPKTTGVPDEEGWPKPICQKRGRGVTFFYPYSDLLAEQIASHLETVAASFLYSDDPMTRAEGRQFRIDANKVRESMTEGS